MTKNNEDTMATDSIAYRNAQLTKEKVANINAQLGNDTSVDLDVKALDLEPELTPAQKLAKDAADTGSKEHKAKHKAKAPAVTPAVNVGPEGTGAATDEGSGK